MSEHGSEQIEPDVAVIGAGSTGSAVAFQCARRGLDVVCIDRCDLDHTGARWANNIPVWTFDAADIPPPTPPELMGESTPLHLFAGDRDERIVIDDHDLIEVDMRRLVERLQTKAKEAGTRFLGGVDTEGFDGETLQTSRGPIRARWFADASGLGGAGLVDPSTPPPRQICAAAQQVRRIADTEGARRFFSARNVPYGDAVCFTGLHGGYSVLNVRAHGDGRLNILTGSIPADGNWSGRRILSNFVAEHRDWIGKELFGGASPIPLGPPVHRLAQGRVAVVGDAARQVLAIHGSGVGPGLIAANVLAEALAVGGGVDDYAVRWHRRYGGLFGAYELFRRFSAQLTPDDLATMMQTGLLGADTARLGLQQHAPIPDRPRLPHPAALIRAPDLMISMGATIAKMARAALLYRRCPRDPHLRSRWCDKLDRLFEPTG